MAELKLDEKVVAETVTKIEEVKEDNPMEVIEDKAVNNEEPISLNEKAADAEFDEIMKEVVESVEPELEHIVRPENLTDAPAGHVDLNKEVEAPLVTAVKKVSEVATKEFTVDKIVNSNELLDVEPEEHTTKDVVVDTEDDAPLMIDEKTVVEVTNITEATKKLESRPTRLDEADVNAALEDTIAELGVVVDQLHEEGEVDGDEQIVPERTEEVKHHDETEREAEFVVTRVQTVTPHGSTDKEVNVVVATIDEEVIADVPETVEAPMDLETDLATLAVEADFAEVVLDVVAEGNPELDLDEVQAAPAVPEEVRSLVDERIDIVKEDGEILGASIESYMVELDLLIDDM